MYLARMKLAIALIRAGRALVWLAERVAPEITAKPGKGAPLMGRRI